MTAYATRLANSADTAPRVRLAEAARMQHGGSALNARGGLRPDNGGVVTVVAGTMGVSVAPFSGWVDGGSSDAQGGYPFVLDAATTVTLTDGHATLSRTDTIVARVRDNTYDASGFTDATVAVIVGTPGAGAPTLPATCVPLRDVTVPAGLSAGTGGLSSGNLAADRRAWTVAAGGVLPVASATVRDALGAKAGQAVYRVDTSNLEVFNGTSWDTYTKSARRARLSSAALSQSLTNATDVTVDFTATDYATGVTASLASNSLTIAAPGVYRVATGGAYAGSTAGRRIYTLLKNGVQLIRENYSTDGVSLTDISVGWEGSLSAGDVITVQAYQSSGGALTFGGYLAISEVV